MYSLSMPPRRWPAASLAAAAATAAAVTATASLAAAAPLSPLHHRSQRHQSTVAIITVTPPRCVDAEAKCIAQKMRSTTLTSRACIYMA